jgi:ribose/xylose/arabinose/galactoside ABC-type transport system permease subunit
MKAILIRFMKGRMAWPLIALVLLLAADQIAHPGFLSIRMQHGHLYGNVIDILRNGAPVALIGLGMTLVIASRGIDLSVGAVVAIAGAISCNYIVNTPAQGSLSAALFGVAIAIVLGLVLGAWNGFLVSTVGIQPIIATLVLMVAGRGIAQLITSGQIITVHNDYYKAIGDGYILALPIPVLITAAAFILAGVLTRRTALGTLIEAIGINPVASRLAGLKARNIIWIVYIVSGLCATVAGLMITANVTAADANNGGLFIELDAILAVVLGGTSLRGGRFSLLGTIVGAFVLSTLTTTVYNFGIPANENLVFEAPVVIAVCLLQSSKTMDLWQRWRRRSQIRAKGVAA